ncbi:hypothetical protein [Streptomyces canus]|uniref:hypothetical protein n=1 Tax=Streptomyces canus TaxID=58343 RepID=UPI0030E06705
MNRQLASLTKLVLDDDIRRKVLQASTDANGMAIDPAPPSANPDSAVKAQISLGEAQEVIAKSQGDLRAAPQPVAAPAILEDYIDDDVFATASTDAY